MPTLKHSLCHHARLTWTRCAQQPVSRNVTELFDPCDNADLCNCDHRGTPRAGWPLPSSRNAPQRRRPTQACGCVKRIGIESRFGLAETCPAYVTSAAPGFPIAACNQVPLHACR